LGGRTSNSACNRTRLAVFSGHRGGAAEPSSRAGRGRMCGCCCIPDVLHRSQMCCIVCEEWVDANSASISFPTVWKSNFALCLIVEISRTHPFRPPTYTVDFFTSTTHLLQLQWPTIPCPLWMQLRLQVHLGPCPSISSPTTRPTPSLRPHICSQLPGAGSSCPN
jgi:hypothetical protein